MMICYKKSFFLLIFSIFNLQIQHFAQVFSLYVIFTIVVVVVVVVVVVMIVGVVAVVVVEVVVVVQMSTNEYKGRTDSNNPTGRNEAVCLATLLLL